MLPELTSPVDLCLPSGALNPAAVAWSRTPLHRANLRTNQGLSRAATWSRTRRWEDWCVITPDHIVWCSVTSLNYAGMHALWVLDRRTGAEVETSTTTPLARDVHLPSRYGGGPTRARTSALAVAVDPAGPTDGALRPGARIRAITPRVRLDLCADVPAGHECLGVVVPWTDRQFQYTVKDVALPVHGKLWVDDEEVTVGTDGQAAWATSDFGRGRWPYTVVRSRGAGSGVVDGVVTGLQLGGRWTDGTGSTENALLVGGRVHYLGEDLSWARPAEVPAGGPWFVTGPRVDVRFDPFHTRVASSTLGVLSTSVDQCFGTWSGWVEGDDGARRQVDGLVGWVEEAANRW